MKRIRSRYVATQQKQVRHIKRIGRKPLFTIPFATFMVLLVLVFVGFLVTSKGSPQLRPNDPNIVVINHDGEERTIPTHAKTVGDLLRRLDIKLNEGDIVEPDKNTEILDDNFRVNVYRAVPVTIVDGAKKTFSYSAAATPRSIVKQAGVTVYAEDRLELLPTENFLAESSIGERVVIDRATPVNVNLYGTPTVMRTHARNVGELLKEKKIKLGKDDSVQPETTQPLTANMQLFLIRKGTQIVTEEYQIAPPVQIVEDESLTFGSTAVRQQGVPGKRLVTFQLELQNGQEIARKQIQEVIAVEPVPQIVARGKAVQIPSDKKAVMALAGIAVSDYPYVDYIISRESGWCPTKMQGQIGYCPPYAPETIPSGKGYGLGQATPGTKMASFGADWKTSAVTQLKWATSYAKSRHGGWAGAYAYWQSHHNW